MISRAFVWALLAAPNKVRRDAACCALLIREVNYLQPLRTRNSTDFAALFSFAIPSRYIVDTRVPALSNPAGIMIRDSINVVCFFGLLFQSAFSVCFFSLLFQSAFSVCFFLTSY